MNKIPKRAFDLITKWEGFKENAYLCPAGVWTIGFGTTKYSNGVKVKSGDKISQEKALKELECYLLNNCDFMKEIKLNDNQLSAILSLQYNIGKTNWIKSTLRKKILININDKEGIQTEWLRWSRAGGKVLNGLLRRRTEECSVFFEN